MYTLEEYLPRYHFLASRFATLNLNQLSDALTNHKLIVQILSRRLKVHFLPLSTLQLYTSFLLQNQLYGACFSNLKVLAKLCILDLFANQLRETNQPSVFDASTVISKKIGTSLHNEAT